jgi:hypothetical protein
MRGILIQHPLEYRLEVHGNTFAQGASVPCSLTVRNHSGSSTTLSKLALELSLGTLKKIKAKEPDAFVVLERNDLGSDAQLAPGAQATIERTITLSSNAPITAKNSSPYLLYGDPSSDGGLGQLLLTVQPHAHVRHIFDTMTTVFNFINKGESHKDGLTIAKLKAPDSRRFSLVEELNLGATFEDSDVLCLRFLFTVKKFDHSGAKVNVKKGKVELTRRLDPREYLFGGGFARQDFLEAEIEAALAEVSSGL